MGFGVRVLGLSDCSGGFRVLGLGLRVLGLGLSVPGGGGRQCMCAMGVLSIAEGL